MSFRQMRIIRPNKSEKYYEYGTFKTYHEAINTAWKMKNRNKSRFQILKRNYGYGTVYELWLTKYIRNYC